MAWEYYLKFDDPGWLMQNKDKVKRLLESLPSYLEQKSEKEIWLKDNKSNHSWLYDIRLLFIEPQSILLEVSSQSEAFSRDVRNLLKHLSVKTSIRLVDDDDEIVDLR